MYRHWCGDAGELPYDYSNFFKALYQLGLPVRKAEKRNRRTGKRSRVVRGLDVKVLS
jgi:hypothetical protein